MWLLLKVTYQIKWKEQRLNLLNQNSTNKVPFFHLTQFTYLLEYILADTEQPFYYWNLYRRHGSSDQTDTLAAADTSGCYQCTPEYRSQQAVCCPLVHSCPVIGLIINRASSKRSPTACVKRSPWTVPCRRVAKKHTRITGEGPAIDTTLYSCVTSNLSKKSNWLTCVI